MLIDKLFRHLDTVKDLEVISFLGAFAGLSQTDLLHSLVFAHLIVYGFVLADIVGVNVFVYSANLVLEYYRGWKQKLASL